MFFAYIHRLLKKRLHLPANSTSKKINDTRITKDEHNELKEYARSNGIKLSNFKKFTGDISIIKDVIDDILTISKDFPLILEGRKSIELSLEFHCSQNDFATTSTHVIYLNAHLFSDIELLEQEYNEAMLSGSFVKNTDYHSIIRHETGHVVANMYHLAPLQIAKDILETQSDVATLEYLRDNLSIYSAEYPDGREIISESFSGYYSNVNNDFANKFVLKCKEIIKGGDVDEKK